MDLYQLNTFLVVAAAGSMRGAARQLSLSQATVGNHIRHLEAELGVSLLRRTSRGVRLNAAGITLLPSAQALVEAEARIRAAVRQLSFRSDNELAIALVPSMAQMLLPRAVRMRDPSSATSLRIYERATTEALDLLGDRHVDFAVVRDPPATAGFSFRPLFEEPLVAVVPSRSDVGQGPISLSDLCSEPFLTFDALRSPVLYQAVLTACSTAGFIPNLFCVGASLGTVGELIASGFGVTVAPLTVARHWPVDRVRIILIAEPMQKSTVVLATVAGTIQSPEALSMARALQRAAKDLVADDALAATGTPGQELRAG